MEKNYEKLPLISYIIGDHETDSTSANVYFALPVLGPFLILNSTFREEMNEMFVIFLMTFFSIKKNKNSQYETVEIWYGLIEYEEVQLLRKSKFMTNKKTMIVDVLHLYGKQKENEVFH